ncbi:MAG: hypothetical protein ACTS2F_29640 [Thainema sp.]
MNGMLLPDLILAARDQSYRRDRLLLLAFEPQSQYYVELESIRLLNTEKSAELQILKIVRAPESIIVATQPLPGTDGDKSCYLIQLDLTLAEIKRIAFNSLTALETDGEHIFISAEGDFIVLSLDLTILSRVELQVTGLAKKDAHGIVVHQKIAYLLDNIFVPVFIFKFDCSDPKNIYLLDKQEFDASQPHLDAQWIDAAAQRWYVLVDNSNRFISGQHLYITEAANPLAEIKFHMVRQDTVEIWNYLSDRTGNKILASTQMVPPWVVVKEGTAANRYLPEKLYLAKVICDREFVRIEPWLDLYPLILEGAADEAPVWHDDFNKFLIHAAGNRLILIASRRNRLITKEEWTTATRREEQITEWLNVDEAVLLVIDTQNQPQILLNQRFEIDNQTIQTFALRA